MVELDAELLSIQNYNGGQKIAFEIQGEIDRNDFGLDKNLNQTLVKSRYKQNIKLVANLEFSI